MVVVVVLVAAIVAANLYHPCTLISFRSTVTLPSLYSLGRAVMVRHNPLFLLEVTPPLFGSAHPLLFGLVSLRWGGVVTPVAVRFGSVRSGLGEKESGEHWRV